MRPTQTMSRWCSIGSWTSDCASRARMNMSCTAWARPSSSTPEYVRRLRKTRAGFRAASEMAEEEVRMRGPSASSFTSSAHRAWHPLRANRILARSLVLRTVISCLLALIPLRAIAASSATTDQAGQPDEPPRGTHGIEIGPTFSMPLPVGSANHDQLGLDAGLSCTWSTENPYLGLGVDFAYHYWPVSAEFKQEFNHILRAETWQTLQLGGGAWGLQVIEFGLHLRVAPPMARGARPWLQVGAGTYHVDPNTSGYSGDAGFFTVTAPPLERTQHLGGSVAVGAELFDGRYARVGLRGTYHVVDCSRRYGKDLQVFTLGAHALFAW